MRAVDMYSTKWSEKPFQILKITPPKIIELGKITTRMEQKICNPPEMSKIIPSWEPRKTFWDVENYWNYFTQQNQETQS